MEPFEGSMESTGPEHAMTPRLVARRALAVLLGLGAAALLWLSARGSWSRVDVLLAGAVGFGVALAASRRKDPHSPRGRADDELDAATGLRTRPAFEQRLALALPDTAGRVGKDAVVIIDIRNFHHINDALGHRHGDELLRQLGQRLRDALPASSLLARLSGDVFGVLLRDGDPADALGSARRLVDIVAPPFSLEGVPIEIEATYGIAAFPEHGQTAALLLQHAETALRFAKERGEPFGVYAPRDETSDARRLQMFGALRAALENDELVLTYQPKLTLDTNAVTGCEALLTWTNARLGRVSPAEFIPIAEQTSLIKPLTHWVLSRAIRQLALWKRDGLHTRVAVNLSARNLSDTTLPSQIRELLSTWGVGAENLMVEITESAVLLDPERAGDVLEQLEKLGVGLSLDDFGTGYSSLTYLRTLPACELKLDRSFIRDVDVNASSASIVRGVTQLAHELDMRVVAEGVETDSQAERVRELGCDIIQGYVLSRPLSTEAFEAFVRTRRPSPEVALPRTATQPTIVHVRERARSIQPLRDSLRQLRGSLHAPPSSQP